MLILLILSVCVNVNLAEENPFVHKNELSSSKLMQRFEEFNAKYKRLYFNKIKMTRKLQIFEENMRCIIDMNFKAKKNIFGITEFADYTQEELDQLFPAYRGMDYSYCNFNETFTVTKSNQVFEGNLDWNKMGFVSEVKHQLLCNSCWAFTGLAAVESAYAIKTNQLMLLSEQELVDCDRRSKGCARGQLASGVQYAVENGVASAEEYPYEGKDGQCKTNLTERVIKIRGCKAHNMSLDESRLLELVAVKGPIAIAISAGKEFLFYTGGGVLENCPVAPVNHGVLLVGYGTDDDGIPYWTMKNSWGLQWGESGYIRVKRGVNACNMVGLPVVQAVA